jgi:hypothetical protein
MPHRSVPRPVQRLGPALLGVILMSGPLLPSASATGATAPSPAPAVRTATAAADDRDGAISWGVGPVATTGKPSRSAFTHRLLPGRSVPDLVRITNLSLIPLTFRVYAHDAVNTLDGGFDLLSGTESSRDIGLWVRISQQSVTVPARSHADVPFRIEVPADAAPGDHSGGIVAAMLGQAEDGSGRNVAVERRVGSRIYGRVPGAVRASLTAGVPVIRYTESLNPFRAGTATVTYSVRNSGNVRLGAHPSVSVRDLTGRLVRTVTGPAVREVLPGQSVTVVSRVPQVWPLGRLTVSAGVRATMVEPAAAEAPPPRGDTTKAYLWAWPWAAMVLLALVVLLAVLWRRRSSPASPATESHFGQSVSERTTVEPDSPEVHERTKNSSITVTKENAP